jgi:mitogen-activated protein kinase 1/3
MMTGKILFKGANYIQMVKLIFEVLGKPDEKDLAEFINNENA